MILQSLVRYYDILSDDEESDISKIGYSKTNISFALNISKEGELLEILPLKYMVMRGKKEVETTVSAIVPEVPKGRTGQSIKPRFICDNAKYVLGIDKETKKSRLQDCFDSFKDLHHEILSEVNTAETMALLLFLDHWSVEEASDNDIVSPFFDVLTAGGNLVIKIDNGRYLHECAEIKQAWEQYKAKESNSAVMQCLVTGEYLPIARLNPSFQRISDKAAMLVSFNDRAYESYGYDKMQGLNAPVSERAAFAYGAALNYLIADRPHTLSIGDATIVYWAESKGNMRRNAYAVLSNPDELTAEESKQTIADPAARKLAGSILAKIADGKKISDEAVFKDNTNFYVAGLSPNAARLSIRFFMQNTFGGFVKNITKHYQDLSIQKQFGTEPDFISPWRMLNHTVSPNAKDKSASPLLVGAVMRAILEGAPYPSALFQMTMLRIKAEQDISYYKAAIIKAYLVRIQYKNSEEVLDMSLNPDSKNTAYLLGRLFAVLEKVQKDANPGIKTTIKDRYFSSACATPLITFPSLLKLSQHHISKAEYGYAGENMMAEIMGKLEVDNNPFPANQPLVDQGIFVLGYYHQRNQIYTKKTDNTTEEDKNHEQCN